MRNAFLSDNSLNALLGNYWLRFPETSKEGLEAIVKSWNLFKADGKFSWSKWERLINDIRIRHKVHKKCEHCNSKADLKAKTCNKPSCDKKKPDWGFWLTFSIEDQLRLILERKFRNFIDAIRT